MEGISRKFRQTQNTKDESADVNDTRETVHVSSLALLKMLRHGRAGVPMEVMGLLVGTFVDEYTVDVIDVFSMPQSGNSVSVESIDEAYQADFMKNLSQTGRPESVVGWYHSHPGFGCWLSGTDISTQQSFERLHRRAVGIVVDPIQSVKGKVVIDCFRLFQSSMSPGGLMGGGLMVGGLMGGAETRQTTSNIGCLNKASTVALINGLNKHYYSLKIAYNKNPLEKRVLQNIHKGVWHSCLLMGDYVEHDENNIARLKNAEKLTLALTNLVNDELDTPHEELAIKNVGNIDPKRGMENLMAEILQSNIMQQMTTLLIKENF